MITADLARLVIVFFHAAGAISLHGVDGLSITSAGNADGCVFRAGTHCRDSEHNSHQDVFWPTRCPRLTWSVNLLIGASVGGWWPRCWGVTQCFAQRALLSGVGNAHSRNEF